MKRFGATLVLSAALGLGAIGTANAADLRDPGRDPGVAIVHSSPLSWYIRGDIGWASYDRPIMVEDGVYDLVQTSIDRSWSAGLGIGRYFTSNVRGDLTWDRRFEADVRGTNADPASPFPGVRAFGLKSDLFLANVYYDFDMRSRFTPYIGVGLGAVHHKTTAGTVIPSCPGGCAATISGDSNWHVAGALMAGFTLALRERVHIDAGYRFLYLGETRTGAITCTTTCGAPVSRDPTVEDIHAHEVRVGLRISMH